MKLNWFSPLPPIRSGIAAVSDALIPAFKKHAQVTYWTDQEQWEPRIDHEIEVRRFDARRPPTAELNCADLNFYNIGNHRLYHQGIWMVSRQHRGIVVLHDLCLHHFFAGVYLDTWNDAAGYRAVMQRLYGRKGHAAAVRLCQEGAAGVIDEIAQSFPLTELALENALGAIVHYAVDRNSWAQQSALPSIVLPLPNVSRREAVLPAVLERSRHPPYRMIVFGFLGSNRRLGPLLEAWAGIPDRSAFRLRICGEVEDRVRVETQIRELGLDSLAEMTGYLSEEALDRELQQADLALNLRYPTMGEASASQLKLWEYALPTLVTKVGWYAGLPPETVAFVRPEQEIDDIRAYLLAFLKEPQRFAEMGLEGWYKLKRDHGSEGYVRSLVGLAETVREWGWRSVRLEMAKRVGIEMRPWVSPQTRDIFSNRLAKAIWEIPGLRVTRLPGNGS
jgi:glycosyltransferase involved in cell wall biosynthesis